MHAHVHAQSSHFINAGLIVWFLQSLSSLFSGPAVPAIRFCGSEWHSNAVLFLLPLPSVLCANSWQRLVAGNRWPVTPGLELLVAERTSEL